MIYLIEQDYVINTAGTTGTLRIASGQGFKTRPSETPSNTVYEPRVINPGNFQRQTLRPGSFEGQSTVGYGVVIINNADGALDTLKDYGFDGQTLVIRYGPDEGSYPADYPIIFKGTTESAFFSFTRVTLRIRDRKAEIYDKQIQTESYLGNNVAPDGVEGTAADIKGEYKPLLYGRVYNITPPMVNTSKLIYQIADNQILSIDAIYDKGNEITFGAAQPSLAALLSSAPSPGFYNEYIGPEGAFFRLGTRSTGLITADATQGALVANRYPGAIIRSIFMERAGLTPGVDFSGDGDMNTSCPYECGVWVDTGSHTIGEVIEEVLRGISGFCVPDALGVFTLGVNEAPSGVPVKEFGTWNALQDSSVSVDGVPHWKVEVSYGLNYTVQNEDELAGAVSDERRIWLNRDYRKAVAENSAIKNKHSLSKPYEIESRILAAGDASTEASRQLSIVSNTILVVQLRMSVSEALGVDIGDTISVKLNRFGWNSGKLFRVFGVSVDYERDIAEIEAWA